MQHSDSSIVIVGKGQYSFTLAPESVGVLERIATKYDLEKTVYITKTEQGYSARFERKVNPFYAGEGVPTAIDKGDAAFFLSLPGLQWFKLSGDCIEVGCNNEPTLESDPLIALCNAAAAHLAMVITRNWQDQRGRKCPLVGLVEEVHRAVVAVGGVEPFNQMVTQCQRLDLQITNGEN